MDKGHKLIIHKRNTNGQESYEKIFKFTKKSAQVFGKLCSGRETLSVIYLTEAHYGNYLIIHKPIENRLISLKSIKKHTPNQRFITLLSQAEKR